MPILLFFSFMKAAILLNLASLRFKQQAVVKANKFGQVRSLSTHHLCVLELMTRVAIQSVVWQTAQPEPAEPAREGGGCAEGRVCRAGDDRG